MMPPAASGCRRSPRMRMPKMAVCTVSVFEYVVPTAKFRYENRWMSTKVAMIWALPPTTV